MAELIINRVLEGLFTHTLDGVQVAIDNKPNLTTFEIIETNEITFHFKTKNGAPLVKDQNINPEDITITDTFGGTPTQTGFTDAVTVWNTLGNLGYFEGYAGAGAGAGGIEYFKQLLDVFPNSFAGQNNKVFVVNEAMNRLEPVFLYNYNRLVQFADVESIEAGDIPNGYVLTKVTVPDGLGGTQELFGFRPQPIVSQTPNGFITLGTFELDGLEFTADTAWTWSQDGVEYGNLTEYEYTIEALPSGSSRWYIFHTLPNSNAFSVTIGNISTTNNALQPTIPIGAIELTSVLLNGSVASEPEMPFIGSDYVTKVSQGIVTYADSSAPIGIMFDYNTGKTSYNLTRPIPYDVPGVYAEVIEFALNNVREGMIFNFVNTGANHLYKHNAVVANVMPFINPANADFLALQGSVMTYIVVNSKLVFSNYSIPFMGTPTLQQVTTAGNTSTNPIIVTVANPSNNGFGTNGNIVGRIVQFGNGSIIQPTGGGGAETSLSVDTKFVYANTVGTTFAGREHIDANFGNATYAKLLGQNIFIKDNNANTSNSIMIMQGATDPNKQLRINLDTTNNLAEIQSILVGITYMRLFLQQEGGDTVIGQDISGAEKLRVGGSTRFHNYIVLGKFTNGTEPAYESGKAYYNTTIGKMKVGGATGWEIIDNENTARSISATIVSNSATYQNNALIGATAVSLVVLNGDVTQPPFVFNSTTGTLTMAVMASDKLTIFYNKN